MSGWRRVVQVGSILAAIGVGAVLGLLDPTSLQGGAGWSVVVVAVLWGYGAALERLLRVTLGAGEQILLGTTIFVLLGGWLLAFGIASTVPLFVVAGGGAGLAVVELVRRARGAAEVSPAKPASADRRLALWLLGSALVAYLTITLLGEIAGRGNPFDDHVAYTAFVKRMLDCGDLIEPFSFRRVSAYGGQTVLLALAALRGDVESTGLLDRGVFSWVVVLVVLDLARKRRLHLGVTAMVVIFLFTLRDLGSNSASAWTGLACFLGAYAFASNQDLSPRTRLLLTFATCGTACTLRQNYLVPAGLFAALMLVSHTRAQRTSSWGAMWRAERRTILLAISAAALVVLPYAIAVWRSNHTFLYPIVLGTGNPLAPLQPAGWTLIDELSFFFAVVIDPEPIRSWWILVPFMILARDTRADRPFPMFLIAMLVGMVFMVHSFTLSEASQLWRYAFGYMTALALVFLIEVSARLPFVDHPASARANDDPASASASARAIDDPDDAPPAPVRVPVVVVFLVWLAVLTQIIVLGKAQPSQRITFAAENFKVAKAIGSSRITDHRDLYPALQAALPEHARLAVMVDDPYLLDYDRNEIFNLDLVGFSALAPGLPSFLGAERWRAYFLAHGIRYLAFVDSTHASYLYPRETWVTRMYGDGELWRFMSAHMIDAMDSFTELARTSRVVFRQDSITALDLGERGAAVAQASHDAPELVRQDQLLRRVSETEFGDTTWQLSSRSDVVFQPDGYGPSAVKFAHPHRVTAGGIIEYTKLTGALGVLLGSTPSEPPHRWLTDRTHIRVHGTGGSYKLHIKLDTDVIRLSTIPTVVATLDAREVARVVADPDGGVVIDATAICAGWCDLYISVSTMSEFWYAADDIRAIKLLELDWLEMPPR